MALITHSARITGPIAYLGTRGRQLNIPLGPCLVERLDEQRVDVIWGTWGQNSTPLRLQDAKDAEVRGDLVLLD